MSRFFSKERRAERKERGKEFVRKLFRKKPQDGDAPDGDRDHDEDAEAEADALVDEAETLTNEMDLAGDMPDDSDEVDLLLGEALDEFDEDAVLGRLREEMEEEREEEEFMQELASGGEKTAAPDVPCSEESEVFVVDGGGRSRAKGGVAVSESESESGRGPDPKPKPKRGGFLKRLLRAGSHDERREITKTRLKTVAMQFAKNRAVKVLLTSIREEVVSELKNILIVVRSLVRPVVFCVLAMFMCWFVSGFAVIRIIAAVALLCLMLALIVEVFGQVKSVRQVVARLKQIRIKMQEVKGKGGRAE